MNENRGYWGRVGRTRAKVHFFLNGQTICGMNVRESNVKLRAEFNEWDPVVNKDLTCTVCATTFQFMQKGMRRISPPSPEAK